MLALRLMGEIYVIWAFAKGEKHTTHTTFGEFRVPVQYRLLQLSKTSCLEKCYTILQER
jgi:hypothetical protein